MNLLEHYQVVLVFLLVGAVMVVAPMVMLVLLRPRKPSYEKEIPYECGKDPIGDAHVCFDLRFYTDALIFVVFDVEAAFLFPWAKVYRRLEDAPGTRGIALFEGLLFVGILALGLVYVWAKGDIDWVKSLQAQPGVDRREGVVPGLPPAPPDLAPEPEPEPEPELETATPASGPVATGGAQHGH